MFRGERALGSADRPASIRWGRLCIGMMLHGLRDRRMPGIFGGVKKMEKGNHVLRLVFLAMMIGLGVVISPILRIEGMCPMAHLINIICSVFMGPWYSLLCATLIGIIRMVLMGIPPLALTGAVFGAALSGILYRASGGRILAAVLGEVIGTGLIGAVVSYPVMELLYGRTGLSWMYYVPLFISGTLIGGSIAFCLLTALAKNGALYEFQRKLGVQVYDRKK